MTNDATDAGDANAVPGREAVPDAASSVSTALVAGAALFNEDHPGAAREPWTAASTPAATDGRLLSGLAAVAAATRRAADDDPTGAAEDAASAADRLADLGPTPRGVDLAPVRAWANRLAADPKAVGRAAQPRVRVDGAVPTFDSVSLPAARLAAPALAATAAPGDPETVRFAADLAREERGTGRTRFAELLFAYLRTPDARPQVSARLADRVDRERRKRRDVEELF